MCAFVSAVLTCCVCDLVIVLRACTFCLYDCLTFVFCIFSTCFHVFVYACLSFMSLFKCIGCLGCCMSIVRDYLCVCVSSVCVCVVV